MASSSSVVFNSSPSVSMMNACLHVDTASLTDVSSNAALNADVFTSQTHITEIKITSPTEKEDDDVKFLFSTPRRKKRKRKRLESHERTCKDSTRVSAEATKILAELTQEQKIRRGTTGMVQGFESCHIGVEDNKSSGPSRSESLPVAPLPASSVRIDKAPQRQEPQPVRAVAPANSSFPVASGPLTSSQDSATGDQCDDHTQIEPEEQHSWKPIDYGRTSAKRHKRDGDAAVANPISADSIQYSEVSPRMVPSPIPASPHDAPWGSGCMHKGNTNSQTIPELNGSDMMPENYSAFPVYHDTQPRNTVPQSLFTTSSADFATASDITWRNSSMWSSIKPPTCSKALPDSDTSTSLDTRMGTPDLASMQRDTNQGVSQVLCSPPTPSSPPDTLNPANAVSSPETLPAASTPRASASLVDLCATPPPLDSQLSQILNSTPLPADGSPQRISELPHSRSSDLLRRPSLYSIPAWPTPNYSSNGHESIGAEIRESIRNDGYGTSDNRMIDMRRISRSLNNLNHSHPAILAGRQEQIGHFPNKSGIPNSPSAQKHTISGNHDGNLPKRARAQYSPNLIVDIAETCQELFPFSTVAERHNVPLQRVFDTFSAIIQLPLLRRADDKRRHGSLGRQRMREYRDAKKAMEEAQKAQMKTQKASAKCVVARTLKSPARRPDLLEVAAKNRARDLEAFHGRLSRCSQPFWISVHRPWLTELWICNQHSA